MFCWSKPPFCQSNAHFRWRSPDFPIFAAYTICFLGNPLFIGMFNPNFFRLKSSSSATALPPRLRQRSWRLHCQKAQPWCLERTEMKPPRNGDFPWETWPLLVKYDMKFQKNTYLKNEEHGDLVWHFPQRCDESISFWTCPWYVFTFLIAHSISHIRWQWISMDALIHVFPGLFHSCGVYSQVFSIATPAYFLAKLTLPLGKLSILCGFTPFFLGTKVNSTLQLVTSQFFMVKPAVFGYLSTLSRLRWGLLEVQWAKLRLVRKWTRNLLGKSWGNGLSEVYIYISIFFFFQHSVFSPLTTRVGLKTGRHPKTMHQRLIIMSLLNIGM